MWQFEGPLSLSLLSCDLTHGKFVLLQRAKCAQMGSIINNNKAEPRLCAVYKQFENLINRYTLEGNVDNMMEGPRVTLNFLINTASLFCVLLMD